jgi:hypothetical protein
VTLSDKLASQTPAFLSRRNEPRARVRFEDSMATAATPGGRASGRHTSSTTCSAGYMAHTPQIRHGYRGSARTTRATAMLGHFQLLAVKYRAAGCHQRKRHRLPARGRGLRECHFTLCFPTIRANTWIFTAGHLESYPQTELELWAAMGRRHTPAEKRNNMSFLDFDQSGADNRPGRWRSPGATGVQPASAAIIRVGVL